ncbi:MAG: prepilin-type N-terminal cleavage/methylation domain-containing protein [Planctomycetia bacterium]|nr:prepilin-type N-terminal cleavage/methylation domain-containing protein [Planctomycetia bacterium]
MSHRSPSHRGVTLLELLVVVFIITLLAAAATRVLRPLLENSQIREASQTITAVLNAARTEAIEKRREVGVMFRPLKGNVNASMILVLVETPPPYGGDSQGSRIQFTVDPQPVVGSNPPAAVLTAAFPQGDGWGSQVAIGDSLQLNYQGPTYQITAIDTSGANPKFTVTSSSTTRWPPKTGAGEPGAAFQFFRQPKQSSATPIQLPVGAVVDLLASGIGDGSFSPTAAQPVMITFSTTGQVSKLYYPGFSQGVAPQDSVFFLVGRPEAAGTSDNLKDLRSLWVNITCQSGLIGVNNNALVVGGNPNVTVLADRKSARRLAATGSNMGG